MGEFARAAVLAGHAVATEFPYVAYISSDDVYIRSGPGKNYYPTAKLKHGEPVEVYRHDPGGWYAIRPPAQSFSWISARQLDVLDDGLAVVNTDRAVARVGSLFSDVRDVIQVRLNKERAGRTGRPPRQRRRKVVQNRPAGRRIPLGLQRLCQPVEPPSGRAGR